MDALLFFYTQIRDLQPVSSPGIVALVQVGTRTQKPGYPGRCVIAQWNLCYREAAGQGYKGVSRDDARHSTYLSAVN